MKIPAIKNRYNLNGQNNKTNAKAQATPPFLELQAPKKTPYLDKNFYIANSNINFKGYDCTPAKFKIKVAYGIDCPCCGQTMLTKKQSNAFVVRISNKTGEALETELRKEYRYLRKNEQNIVDILIEDSKKYPDSDLSSLVTQESKSSIEKLEKIQKELMAQMREISSQLSAQKRAEFLGILQSEENLIDNSDDFVHFKRRNFIDKVYNFKDSCQGKDGEIAAEIWANAQKMPTSATSIDAFFVKYARRKNEDIARRLVLPAMSTTEHIKPQSKNGKNNTDNYIPLCGDCNSKRGNTPYNEWFKTHPEMPENLQKYIYQVEALINDEDFARYWDFYDNYTSDVIKAINEETNGQIKLLTTQEAKEKGIIVDDGLRDEVLSKKPKTIEEKRDIWMEKYEDLMVKIATLLNLKDELYADHEFMNILAFVRNRDLLKNARQFLKIFEDNKNLAKNALNRAYRAREAAAKKNEPLDEYEKRVEEKKAAFEEAKADYEEQLKRVEILECKHVDLINKGVVTPEELTSEINDKRRKIQALLGAEAGNVNAEFEINDASANIALLERKIEEFSNLNASIEKNIDFNSNAAKRVQARYNDITNKIKAIEKINKTRFNQYFNLNDAGLNADFILDEALSSLQKQYSFLMKNPIAVYIKRQEDIKEFVGQKAIYEAKLDKMREVSKIQAEIASIERRRNIVQRKFANIDIIQNIEKLKDEANMYLQQYTDSFCELS